MLQLNTIHCLDAITGLKQLDEESINCVITSPPYWALRDYELGPLVWGGDEKCAHDFPDNNNFRLKNNENSMKSTDSAAVSGHPSAESQLCKYCGAWKGSLGLEPTFEMYVEHLLIVFDEVHRVLKKTGTLWVNLGDTYVGSWGSAGQSAEFKQRRESGESNSWFRPGYDDMVSRPPSSLKQRVPRRSLCQIPSRFSIAMAERGWILRNDIVWHKPNHMPVSVKNRFAGSWEHLFFFVKSEKYYFDLDAVRVPHTSLEKTQKPGPERRSPHLQGLRRPPRGGEVGSMHPLGKNPADFWTIPSETRTWGAILGASGAVKVPGGAGWTGHVPGGQARILRDNDPRWLPSNGKNPGDAWDIKTVSSKWGHFAVFPEKLIERPIIAGCPKEVCTKCGMPRLSRVRNRNGTPETIVMLGCDCKVGFQPGIVLDPFIDSGTTAVVAKRLGRRFIGFELNANYMEIAMQRLGATARFKSETVAA